MPKFTFQWNSVPKLILGAELHRLVPKLFLAEVTRAEHRLPNPIYVISHRPLLGFRVSNSSLATKPPKNDRYKVTNVNSSDFVASVQPGVTRLQLNEYIRDTGLMFPIDPGADATGKYSVVRPSGSMYLP